MYELYAVMVHNGTANHGHYFSYIKSFEVTIFIIYRMANGTVSMTIGSH